MAKRLLRAEVERCEFDGKSLCLVTGWIRTRQRTRMITRLTQEKLPFGNYCRRIPKAIRKVFFP
jgi:hypothetical protein